jgi:hypothetical protein
MMSLGVPLGANTAYQGVQLIARQAELRQGRKVGRER